MEVLDREVRTFFDVKTTNKANRMIKSFASHLVRLVRGLKKKVSNSV